MKPDQNTDFAPLSSKQWKLALQAGLKGADYKETLVWESLEGIHVKPFYHFDEDRAETPAFYPKDNWKIAETFYTGHQKNCSKIMDMALANGAESIILQADKPFNIASLMEGKPRPIPDLYLQTSFLDIPFFEEILTYYQRHQGKAFLMIDPVGQWVRTGQAFQNLSTDIEILRQLSEKYPDTPLVGIHSAVYREAGANAVQQLAYTLAHITEYANINPKMPFTVQWTVSGNYFFEIAKIRALRWLFASLADKLKNPHPLHILARPELRNKTLYDYNVNLLRTTTECMSAAIGGADAIANLPYDAFFMKDNAFSRRLARNQLLLIKEESYLYGIQNPADGCYYIENLTRQLAEKALALFKQTEKDGGLLAQLKKGIIQDKIEESHQKELRWLQEHKTVLVGSSKYRNENEKMKEAYELYPFVKKRPEKTIIKPLIARRLAEETEKNRLENED